MTLRPSIYARCSFLPPPLAVHSTVLVTHFKPLSFPLEPYYVIYITRWDYSDFASCSPALRLVHSR